MVAFFCWYFGDAIPATTSISGQRTKFPTHKNRRYVHLKDKPTYIHYMHYKVTSSQVAYATCTYEWNMKTEQSWRDANDGTVTVWLSRFWWICRSQDDASSRNANGWNTSTMLPTTTLHISSVSANWKLFDTVFFLF